MIGTKNICKTVFVSLLFCAIPMLSAAKKFTFPEYAHLVQKHARLQGLDENLIWAVMGRESEGNPRALSKENARGLMQVIPPTAARMGVNPKHLYDPEQNIIAGTRYLKFLSKYFKGNLDLILAGYNAGEGAVNKYNGIPPYPETKEYVKNVKYRYSRLSGKSVASMPVPSGGFQTAEAGRSEWVYTAWMTGKKADRIADKQPVKVVKTIRVKDVPKAKKATETVPARIKSNVSGFVQTLDADGNFVTL